MFAVIGGQQSELVLPNRAIEEKGEIELGE